MTPKMAALLFVAACVVGRLYRSRLGPLITRLVPKPVAPAAQAGLAAVEHLATHELAQVLAARVQLDADEKANRLKAEALVTRLQNAIDPAPATSPATDPKA